MDINLSVWGFSFLFPMPLQALLSRTDLMQNVFKIWPVRSLFHRPGFSRIIRIFFCQFIEMSQNGHLHKNIYFPPMEGHSITSAKELENFDKKSRESSCQ